MFANVSIRAEDNLLDTDFGLTIKGVALAAKIKITLSLIPKSGDYWRIHEKGWQWSWSHEQF